MARTKLINLRVSDEEHKALQKLADFNNCSVSEYIRGMATSEFQKPMMKATIQATPPNDVRLGYRCPSGGCGFRAGSPAATCPHHGRKVISDWS